MEAAVAIVALSGVTDTPIAAIAAKVGYYDHSHMTNEFRREKGMSPREYRERNQRASPSRWRVVR